MRFVNVYKSKKQSKSVFTSLFVRVYVVAAILSFSIAKSALAKSGKIIGWGSQVVGIDLSGGFSKVAAGSFHSLGLKQDGSIVAWGDNTYGECNIPSPNNGFIAIAAGENHSLGLKQDGFIAVWGYNEYGQCNVPEPNSGFVAVAAGYDYSLGVKIIFGDLSGDGDIDSEDLLKFTEHWLETGCERPYGCQTADLDNDTDVDFSDLAVFADQWLENVS
jgi:hypothetical protein